MNAATTTVAESAEDCFCKGSAPLKQTCLLMLKLLRSLNVDFRNETFQEIAKDMDTDVESLYRLYHQICLSKKLARQLGCHSAADEEGRLRRDRKKRKRGRPENKGTSGPSTKKVRIAAGGAQVADSATDASATPTTALNLKEEDDDDDGDDDENEGGAAARQNGSSLLDQLEADLGWTRETALADEDDLP